MNLSTDHDRQPSAVCVRTATHEIRTPLAVIVGYLEILADTPGAVDPRFQRQVQAVLRNADRLADAVDDLLRGGLASAAPGIAHEA